MLVLHEDGVLQRFPLLACEDCVPRVERLLTVLQAPTTTTPTTQALRVEEFSHGWGRGLLPPWDAIADKDVLIIVPHDLLHGVPLHLVKPTATDAFLATSHGISYCSSGTLFRRCVQRNAARRGRPLEPRRCATLGVDVLTDKDDDYRGLADAFGRHFVAPLRLETRTELKDHLDPRVPTAVDVFCVVCHGYPDGTEPRQSGLLLKDSSGVTSFRGVRVHGDQYLQFRDWPFGTVPAAASTAAIVPSEREMFYAASLTVGELMVGARTMAELVALFGCATGTGEVGAGDDYRSLAYQWLKLGAASVLANLWEADLPVLSRLADRFAAIWAPGGVAKALALRTATRQLLDEDRDLASRPALWGSLVLLGDWA